jgi:hypothetical protein
MKRLVIIISFIISFALTLMALMTEAHAETPPRTYYLNPIEISDLSPYRGKYLSVFYALGSRGSLNNQEDQITIREVKEKKTFLLTGDSLSVPEINLKRSNVFITYNILVFVIHDHEVFTWVNANHTLPEGQTNSTNIEYIDVASLTKIEFDQMRNAQAAELGSPVKYRFGYGIQQ